MAGIPAHAARRAYVPQHRTAVHGGRDEHGVHVRAGHTRGERRLRQRDVVHGLLVAAGHGLAYGAHGHIDDVKFPESRTGSKSRISRDQCQSYTQIDTDTQIDAQRRQIDI